MTHTALLGVYYSCSSELLVSGYSCGIRAKEVCLGLELRLFPFCKPVLAWPRIPFADKPVLAWPRIPFADKPLLPLIAHSLSPHLRLTLTLSLIIRTLGSPLTLTLAPYSVHRLYLNPNPSPVLLS